MVEWHFLDSVLQQMGFGSIWRGWINSCLATTSVSVLVNGTPTSPFPMKRGLGQGDPLSPFLFVLVVEVLSRLLHTASSGGLFRGLKVRKDEVHISHLQFADDTIVMCEAQLDYIRNVKKLLQGFQAISGLKVNYQKSGLLVLGMDDAWKQEALSILGCSLLDLPFNYLGFPLGTSMRLVSSWNPILQKIKQKLAFGKLKHF